MQTSFAHVHLFQTLRSLPPQKKELTYISFLNSIMIMTLSKTAPQVLRANSSKMIEVKWNNEIVCMYI